MHRASGPAYTFIIVGFGLFRKCFHDNFFTKKRGAQIFSHTAKNARPGKGAAAQENGVFLHHRAEMGNLFFGRTGAVMQARAGL